LRIRGWFGGFVVDRVAGYAAIRQPPARFGELMARVPPFMMGVLPFRPLWMSARAGTLLPGEIAPDFELPTLHGDGVIKLSEIAREKPVVLVFGSYT
jgi:hypothetical protein